MATRKRTITECDRCKREIDTYEEIWYRVVQMIYDIDENAVCEGKREDVCRKCYKAGK